MIGKISKRLIALLMTVPLTVGMVPGTVLAAENGISGPEAGPANPETGETPAGEENQITEMQDIDEETYKELGLGDIKKYDVNNTTTAPFSVNPDADTQLFSGREIYTFADGHGRRGVYTIRDGFDRMGNINPSSDTDRCRRGALRYYNIDHWEDACEEFSSEYRTDSAFSSNNGNSLAKQSDENTCMYATSVSFNGGDGKENYIAELRAYGRDYKNGHDANGGGVVMKSFKVDAKGNRSLVEEKLMDYSASSQYNYIGAAYSQEFSGAFEITAGDFDGDGVDDLAIYPANYTDSGDGHRYAQVYVYRGTGNGHFDKNKEIMLPAGQTEQYRHEGDAKGWETTMEAYPIVTMASDDFEGNGTDELAITVSAPTGHAKVADVARAYVYGCTQSYREKLNGVTVSGANQGLVTDTITKWKFDMQPLEGLNGISLVNPDGVHAMVSANCTFGTYKNPKDNCYQNVLIIAGYQSNWANSDRGSHKYSNLAIKYVYHDEEKDTFRVSDYFIDTIEGEGSVAYAIIDAYTEGHDGRGEWRPVHAPIALACAHLDPVTSDNHNDTLLLCGMLYNTNIFEMTAGNNALGNHIGSVQISSSVYTAYEGYLTSPTMMWIEDVRVGSVDSNAAEKGYREAFVYVSACAEVASASHPNNFYDVGIAYKNENGIQTRLEGVFNNSEPNRSNDGNFLSLCLPDIDQDSVTLKYVSSHLTFSNPQVLAVLEAPPYYKDLQQKYSYAGGSNTTVTKTDGKIEDGKIDSQNWNVGFYAARDTGIKIYKTEAQLTFEVSPAYAGSRSHQKSKTSNISCTANAAAGSDHKVVLSALTMMNYVYSYHDPATGETKYVEMPSCAKVSTSVMNVDKYDKIAARTKGLDTIGDTILNGIKAGDPYSYKKLPEGQKLYEAKGKSSVVVASSGGTQQQSIAITETEQTVISHGFTLNAKLGAAGSMDSKIPGITIKYRYGMVAGGGAQWGKIEGTIKGSTFAGSVANVPNNCEAYGFHWQLFVMQSHLAGQKDKDGVPVVAYRTDGVERPAQMPQNLRVVETGKTNATIQWDKVADAENYEIAFQDDTGNYNTKDVVSKYRDTYELKGLISNRIYKVAVRTINTETGNSEYTPVAIINTLTEQSEFKFFNQPKDMTVDAGTDVTFSSEAKYYGEDGEEHDVRYQWQVKEEDSWKNIENKTSSTLELKNISRYLDGNEYRCRVHYNEMSYYSQIASLTVKGKESKTSLAAYNETAKKDLHDKDFINAGNETAKSEESVRSCIAYVADQDNFYELLSYKEGEETKYLWKNEQQYYPMKDSVVFESDGEKAGQVDQNYTLSTEDIDLDHPLTEEKIPGQETLQSVYQDISDKILTASSVDGDMITLKTVAADKEKEESLKPKYMYFVISGPVSETIRVCADEKGEYKTKWEALQPGVYRIHAEFNGDDLAAPSSSEDMILYATLSGKSVLSIDAPTELTYGEAAQMQTSLISQDKAEDVTEKSDLKYKVKIYVPSTDNTEEAKPDSYEIKGHTFTPKSANIFKISASYGDSTSEEITITVNRRSLTIAAQDISCELANPKRTELKKVLLTGLADWDSDYENKLEYGLDYEQESKGLTATKAGEYEIAPYLLRDAKINTYTEPVRALQHNYEIHMKNATYTITDVNYTVSSDKEGKGSIKILNLSTQSGLETQEVPSGEVLPEKSAVRWLAKADKFNHIHHWVLVTKDGEKTVVSADGSTGEGDPYTGDKIEITSLHQDLKYKVYFEEETVSMSMQTSTIYGNTVDFTTTYKSGEKEKDVTATADYEVKYFDDATDGYVTADPSTYVLKDGEFQPRSAGKFQITASVNGNKAPVCKIKVNKKYATLSAQNKDANPRMTEEERRIDAAVLSGLCEWDQDISLEDDVDYSQKSDGTSAEEYGDYPIDISWIVNVSTGEHTKKVDDLLHNYNVTLKNANYHYGYVKYKVEASLLPDAHGFVSIYAQSPYDIREKEVETGTWIPVNSHVKWEAQPDEGYAVDGWEKVIGDQAEPVMDEETGKPYTGDTLEVKSLKADTHYRPLFEKRYLSLIIPETLVYGESGEMKAQMNQGTKYEEISLTDENLKILVSYELKDGQLAEAKAGEDYIIADGQIQPRAAYNFHITASYKGCDAEEYILKVSRKDLEISAQDVSAKMESSAKDRAFKAPIMTGLSSWDEKTVQLADTKDYTQESLGLTAAEPGDYDITLKLVENSDTVQYLHQNYMIKIHKAVYHLEEEEKSLTVELADSVEYGKSVPVKVVFHVGTAREELPLTNPELSLQVSYEGKDGALIPATADKDYVIKDGKFQPRAAGQFHMLAKYKEYTSGEAVIAVTKGKATIMPQNITVEFDTPVSDRHLLPPVISGLVTWDEEELTLLDGVDYTQECSGLTATQSGNYDIILKLVNSSQKVQKLNQNYTITVQKAIYHINKAKYTVKASASGKGSIMIQDMSSDGKKVVSGSKLTVNSHVRWTATAEEGYEIEKWTKTVNGKELLITNEKGGSVSGAKPYTGNTIDVYMIIRDCDLTVYFKEKPKVIKYTLTFTQPANGSLTVTDAAGNTYQTGDKIPSGTTLTARVKANTGYGFKQWTKGLTGTKASMTFTMKSDMTIQAAIGKCVGINYGLNVICPSPITIKWGKVPYVDGYDVFAVPCSKSFDYTKPVKSVTAATTSVQLSKINNVPITKFSCYKFIIRAYQKVAGKKVYVESSLLVHRVGTSKTYTNVATVKLNFSTATMRAGASKQIVPTAVKQITSKKILPSSHIKTWRYISTNTKVATVSSTGKITAKAKGSCTIYVISGSGSSKSIKVTVQ